MYFNDFIIHAYNIERIKLYRSMSVVIIDIAASITAFKVITRTFINGRHLYKTLKAVFWSASRSFTTPDFHVMIVAMRF